MGQGKPGVQKDIRAFFVAPLQRSAESGKPEDSPASPQQAASRQLAGGGARRQAVPAADSKIGAACTGTDESGRATTSADACIGADGAKQAADAAAPEVAAIAELDGPPAAAADVRKGSSNFSSSSGLTEYELERLARIRRNQEVMLSLGLAGPSVEPKQAPAAPPGRPPRKRPAAVAAEGASGAPVRRSTRTRGAAAAGAGEGGATAAGAAAAAAPDPDPEPELQYDDSSVRRYVCEVLAAGEAGQATGNSSSGAGGSTGAIPARARVAGFRRLPGCLHDPALARAYSVDSRPGLVVAGGKDGVVAVWGSRQLEAGHLSADDSVPPLLSHKLHKGWVADVQFVRGSGGLDPSSGSSGTTASSLLLLSAGNDGALCLWDLGRAAETGGSGRSGSVVPQCLARSADLHAGGIFSLAEHSGRVLTASKDATVAISSLEGSSGTTSLAAVQRYDELHEGVVKCARWRDADTFASCGNDRRLCVVDARQPPSAGPSLSIEGAHATAINCLRWSPSSAHVLLSASHDPAILLHDIRQPGQPLHRLLGHSPAARINSIYQPAFVAGGDAVAASCERSPLLSLYCVHTGAAISRGSIDAAVGATACGAERGAPLLCTGARTVVLYQTTWEAA